MKKNQQQLDAINCDGCGRPFELAGGKFLRPLLLVCEDCKQRTRWYPRKKALDPPAIVGVKTKSH